MTGAVSANENNNTDQIKSPEAVSLACSMQQEKVKTQTASALAQIKAKQELPELLQKYNIPSLNINTLFNGPKKQEQNNWLADMGDTSKPEDITVPGEELVSMQEKIAGSYGVDSLKDIGGVNVDFSSMFGSHSVDSVLVTNSIPDEVLQRSSIDIHKYLQSHLGAQYDPDQFTVEDAPLPYKGVVRAGHENDDSVEHSLPDTISIHNLQEIVSQFLIERQDYPEQAENYALKLQEIADQDPEGYKKLAYSVRNFFEIKGALRANPYLTERAIKSMISLQYTLQSGNIDTANTLAIQADMYYMLVAMGVDVSGAKELKSKVNPDISYIIKALNKNDILALSAIGIDLPLDYLEEYNQSYASFIEKGTQVYDK